jgi:hypothetical protein
LRGKIALEGKRKRKLVMTQTVTRSSSPTLTETTTKRKCKIKSEGSFKNMVKSKNSALKNTKMDSTTLDSYNTLQDLKLMELSRSLINNLFSERK